MNSMVNIFNVQKPRDIGAPVPANVVAPMLFRLRLAPDGGILWQSNQSDAKYISGEVLFTDGDYKGAKAFPNLVVEGSSDGAKTAQSVCFALIGSMVRSAMGVKWDDMSPAVEAKLANFNLKDLNGMRFIGKTGPIERGKLRDPGQGPNGERYNDKTKIARGVTPDMEKDWKPWASAPHGFNLDNGLDGATEPGRSRPNGSGDSGAVVDTPPWGEWA
jgi:hypothetical protein